MGITVNIVYSGSDDNAEKFVEEMIASGIVDRVRGELGNERYEYFFPVSNHESVLLIDQWTDQNAIDLHHKSPMMSEIAQLRDKYKLRMKVTRYKEID